ncbi:hypothetical protein ACOBQB_12580 [Streptomyces sp. G5(2025)]|uniref:hypothetical protein n=1 Tax=Streptomyces sp. G5(2025) TaxID=3406628 RepID=UPI003C1AC70C
MSTGQNWRDMWRPDFDRDAQNLLPVKAPARIPARPDAYGTEALFGEVAPDRRPSRKPTVKAGDVEGQDELF